MSGKKIVVGRLHTAPEKAVWPFDGSERHVRGNPVSFPKRTVSRTWSCGDGVAVSCQRLCGSSRGEPAWQDDVAPTGANWSNISTLWRIA
jgi:hypothetical protein